MAVTGSALAAQTGIVSFEEFRARLTDRSRDELEFAAELAEMLPTGHDKSVAASLLRSVRGLAEEGQDILRLASVLAVAPIAPKLIVSTFGRVDAVDEEMARQRTLRGLAQVERASLAERDDDGARRIHVLISRTIGFHDANPSRTGMLRDAVILCLQDSLPSPADIRAHQRFSLEIQHARALCGQEPFDPGTAGLAGWVGVHDLQRGMYASAMQLQVKAFEARRQILGAEDPNTLTSMHNLASTLHARGDFEGARLLQARVSEICSRVLGDTSPLTLKSNNNLSVILRELGDLAGARLMQEDVLKSSRRMLGDEHPDTPTAMGNLAAMFRAQGDLAAASSLQRNVLDGFRQMFGEEHRDTLTAMNNLAQTLRAQNDLAGAYAILQRVFEISRGVFGREAP